MNRSRDTTARSHRAFLDGADPQRDRRRSSALVQYVLSIDNDTPVIPMPPLGPGGGVLCAKP